jgi:hypothetical protein
MNLDVETLAALLSESVKESGAELGDDDLIFGMILTAQNAETGHVLAWSVEEVGDGYGWKFNTVGLL